MHVRDVISRTGPGPNAGPPGRVAGRAIRIRRGRYAAALSVAALIVTGCSGGGAPAAAAPKATADHRSPSPATTPAASPSAAPAAALSPLASRRLRRYLAGRAGDVTAALYDASTRQMWLYHPRLREYTASIVKVEIMGTALQEAESAGHSLPPSEAALMPSMIENSDNDSATALLADVGGPSAVAQFDRSAGLTQTQPSTLAFIPGTSLPGWGLTTTSALDEVTLVSRFAYPNPVLSDTFRQYGLSLMENIESDQSWGVSGGVPPGTVVALKNGWLPLGPSNWQIDSIGWIAGHGRNYVLAVLTEDNPTEQYGIDTIETIASDIYQAESTAGP